MKQKTKQILAATLGVLALLPSGVRASSHMDAPLITRDPSANTTDVYAFVNSDNGKKSLVVALGVYPHEEPGVGPNKYNFDDNVLYEIHVATGADVAAGKPTFSYQFLFTTKYKTVGTILQSYVGVINDIGDAGQNLVQSYTVTKVDHRSRRTKVLGSGIVPPNNQGKATPLYNQSNDGDKPAKDGVSTFAALDHYTQQAIKTIDLGYVAFAGQRDDGFYGDIDSIFDLLKLRSPGKDSQAGFNIHLMALEIPLAELGSDQQVVGVYATTSRQQVTVLRHGRYQKARKSDDGDFFDSDGGAARGGSWIQVARQGNPLFNEGLVAIADKDLYSRTSPSDDAQLFKKYALTPELAHLINVIVLGGTQPSIETNRTDIAGIFIPDLIKVDLSTPAARLAGSGANNNTNPDDAGFSRLSVFGNDVLKSAIQDPLGNGGYIPGGWPNGRRFGDDVVDIAVTALISDLRGPIVIRGPAGDGVDHNDVGYNKTFPYESTPQNGRNHAHQ